MTPEEQEREAVYIANAIANSLEDIARNLFNITEVLRQIRDKDTDER